MLNFQHVPAHIIREKTILCAIILKNVFSNGFHSIRKMKAPMRKEMCYEIRNSYGPRIIPSEIFRILFSIRAIIETQLKLTFNISLIRTTLRGIVRIRNPNRFDK